MSFATDHPNFAVVRGLWDGLLTGISGAVVGLVSGAIKGIYGIGQTFWEDVINREQNTGEVSYFNRIGAAVVGFLLFPFGMIGGL